MVKTAAFSISAVAFAVLAGCGQKGPLYLPDKGGEVVTRPGGGQAGQQQSQQTQSPQTAPQPADTDDPQKKKEQQNPR